MKVEGNGDEMKTVDVDSGIFVLQYPWDITRKNGETLCMEEWIQTSANLGESGLLRRPVKVLDLQLEVAGEQIVLFCANNNEALWILT